MRDRYVDAVAWAAWVVALFVLTLRPADLNPDAAKEVGTICLLCGPRGTADAILNFLLFLPLGILVQRRGSGAWAAALVGVVLSTVIEVVQLFIPGRFATLGDVVWNGAGASAGVAIAEALGARRLVRAARRASVVDAGAGAALVLGLGLIGTGWLLESVGTYEGELLVGPAHYAQSRYPGEVLSSNVGGVADRNWRTPENSFRIDGLGLEWTLHATLIRTPASPSQWIIVEILDTQEHQHLALGIVGDRVVLRERTRAAALRLDQPDLHLLAGLESVSLGDTIVVGARRAGGTRCLSVDAREVCGLGHTPGRSWALVMNRPQANEVALRFLDGLWMFILVTPVGLLSTGLKSLLLNGGLISVAVAVAAASTGYLPSPATEWLGVGLGLIVGALVRGGVRRQHDAESPASGLESDSGALSITEGRAP